MKRRGKTLITVLILGGIAGFIITSCDPSKKWEKEEKLAIQNFLGSIGDTVYELKPSGLYYLTLTEGTGATPAVDDTVAIRFKGYFLNYKLFDSNIGMDDPLSFIVGAGYIISGLEEGVKYMKLGGKSKMITPSSLAYGSAGIWGLIAGYTPLLWEIELVELSPAK
jgi:FKBP-type peptidyl-prolyl cis-trans isomerase